MEAGERSRLTDNAVQQVGMCLDEPAASIRSDGSVLAVAGRALARRHSWLLIVFVLSFLFFSALKCFRRLWYDELFIYYVAKRPGLKGIWLALTQGADNHPILGYVLTQWSQTLLGDSPFSIRLPAMLGFLLMCISLYLFAEHRLPKIFAVAAMIFPALSASGLYAVEARPYGPFFGFSALALVCWQRAAEGAKRQLNLGLLALALLGAILCHVYSVVVLAWLILGEFVRTLKSKRIDWAIWSCLLIPALGTLSYLPLLRSTEIVQVIAGPEDRPTWFSPLYTYYLLLDPSLAAVLLALLLIFVITNNSTKDQPGMPKLLGLPQHELTVVAGLASFPIFATVLSVLTTGIYWPRHGYVSIIGLTILLVFFVATYSRHHVAAGGLLAGSFLFFYIVAKTIWLIGAFHPWPKTAADNATHELALSRGILPPMPRGLPIVISNGIEYLEFFHYAEPDIAPRLYFLTDRNAALKYNKFEVPDGIYSHMKQWAGLPMNVVPYAEFVAAHPHFLVYGAWASREDWTLRKLSEDGATLWVKGVYRSARGDLRELLVEVNVNRGH